MSRRANYTLGTILLVASIAVFSVIGIYAVPRLMAPVSEGEVLSNDTKLSDSVIAAVETATPAPNPTDTPEPTVVAPTDEPADASAADSAAETSVEEPTVEPTQLPTATSIPTEEAVASADVGDDVSPAQDTASEENASPEEDNPPEENALLEEAIAAEDDSGNNGVISTIEPMDAPVARANKDAALFVEVGGFGGRVGYFVPQGQSAYVLGRSDDNRWLHVMTQLGGEGWAAASFFDYDDDFLSDVDVSSYVGIANPNITPSANSQTAIANANQTAPAAFPTPQPPANNNNNNNGGNNNNQQWPQPTPTWSFPTPPPPPTAQPSNGGNSSGGGNSGGGTDESVGTNAIAWWQLNAGSQVANGNGTWRADIIVRVPTSFQYTFDMNFLFRVVLRDRNLDGDDYYVLSVSGMSCGQALNSSLIARQNGALMMVFNEFSVSDGPIFLNPPC